MMHTFVFKGQFKQKGVVDSKRLKGGLVVGFPQCIHSIMALQAFHGLITQNNYLMVKCWSGIKEISVWVSALEVLSPGQVVSALHLAFPWNLLGMTDWRTWVKMPEGKTIPKTFFIPFISAMRHWLCLVMILWRKAFHLKGYKTSLCYPLNIIYWWSTISTNAPEHHLSWKRSIKVIQSKSKMHRAISAQ